MKISFGTRINELKGIRGYNGYGYATNCMLDSLRQLGYHVEPNDASADVEIWFDQPHHWNFSEGPYKIGYHPWESTLLEDGWAEIMNQCDEIWTPSEVVADWYVRYNDINVPVHVYEHGVSKEWFPYRRSRPETMRYLHIGAEAARKGGWDTVRAFRKAFQAQENVELTLKMVNSPWNQISRVGRVEYIDDKYDFAQLQKLYYDCHVFVYPSHGEGFGFTPIQAMATGMPTITLPGWAPYRDHIDPNLAISHKMAKSPWPGTHPGMMMRPDFEEVVDAIQYTYENYDECVDFAMEQAELIHKNYDWLDKTAEAFGALQSRLGL